MAINKIKYKVSSFDKLSKIEQIPKEQRLRKLIVARENLDPVEAILTLSCCDDENSIKKYYQGRTMFLIKMKKIQMLNDFKEEWKGAINMF